MRLRENLPVYDAQNVSPFQVSSPESAFYVSSPKNQSARYSIRSGLLCDTYLFGLVPNLLVSAIALFAGSFFRESG